MVLAIKNHPLVAGKSRSEQATALKYHIILKSTYVAIILIHNRIIAQSLVLNQIHFDSKQPYDSNLATNQDHNIGASGNLEHIQC